MAPMLIVLAIVVGISVLISVAANWLRAQQTKLDTAAAEKRARQRQQAGGASPRAGASDVDRFLAEVNKLRQKPPAATAKPKRAEPIRPPVARPVEPPQPPARFEDLPVAPVVARPVALPAAVPIPPAVPAQSASARPQTAFARQLAGLLSGPHSLATAVVLKEVLGPPKCRPVSPPSRPTT